nr:MAG TPA: RNA polymerase I subunit [Caudoviricetes sp.]
MFRFKPINNYIVSKITGIIPKHFEICFVLNQFIHYCRSLFAK